MIALMASRADSEDVPSHRHSLLEDLRMVGHILTHGADHALFRKAVAKSIFDAWWAIGATRIVADGRRFRDLGPLRKLAVGALWVPLAGRIGVLYLAATRPPPPTVSTENPPTTFLGWYRQKHPPMIYSRPSPLAYRLIDVEWYLLFGRHDSQSKSLLSSRWAAWEPDMVRSWQWIVDMAVEAITEAVGEVDGLTVALVADPGVGARWHAASANDDAITVSLSTTVVTVRAIKYWIVFHCPDQRVYYQAARMLLPRLRPERGFLAEDLEQLFTSTRATGVPSSRLLRLNLTGVVMQAQVLQDVITFLVAHELGHRSLHRGRTEASVVAESEADAYALRVLRSIYPDTVRPRFHEEYDQISASGVWTRYLRLPATDELPWPVQVAGYALFLAALAGNETSTRLDDATARLRTIVSEVYGDLILTALEKSLTDDSKLLGFFRREAWRGLLPSP